MKKILSFVSLMLIISAAYAADSQPIYCPNANDITVNVMAGTASAPGGWTGQSAVPLNHIKDWRNNILWVSASGNSPYQQGGVAECQYETQNVMDIVDIKRSIPSNYNLYDSKQGITPTYQCTDGEPSIGNGYKECYWFTNSVFSKTKN